MNIWTVKELVEGTGGSLEQEGTRSLEGVATDSRKDLKGKVFFALRGENFDAHEFAGQAVEKGASALIIDKAILKVRDDVTVIRVPNTLEALQKFGSWHRRRWSGKLVGLTGSNGKTTTKEFAATILSQKFPTLATKGNLNNHIGVPLTLLELRPEHKFAIIEMGMNHEGEIANLAQIAQPDIVLVTNVGRAHIEYFGAIEKIARAKEEIYESAPLGATRIYNMDDQHTGMMRARAPGGCRVITFSSYGRSVDVSFKEKVLTLDYLEIHGFIGKEPGQVKVPSFGRQHLANSMAASCIALACGLEPRLIWKGLANCRSSWGRSQVVDLESGARVLFDAYNANPESVTIAFENFSKLSTRGRKYVVFGDMKELGEQSAPLHQEVGRKIAELGVEGVLIFGQYARDVESGLRSKGFKKNIVFSETYEEKLAVAFGSMLQTGDMVLVKASRGMELERVVLSWRPTNFTK